MVSDITVASLTRDSVIDARAAVVLNRYIGYYLAAQRSTEAVDINQANMSEHGINKLLRRSNARRYLPLAPRLYHYLSRRLHTAISFASYTPPSLISLASYTHRHLFRRVYTAISLASAEDRPSLRLETWLGWPRACTSRRHLHFRWACVRVSV